MQKQEFFKLSRKQQVSDEVSKFFHFRHQRLQRLILDENLLPTEKAVLTMLESELGALENILADELYQLDKKLEITTKEIEAAKNAEKHL